MVSDRPTASVTGQEDWEWNERCEGGSSSDATVGSTGGRRGSVGPLDRPADSLAREAALRREIRELEAELERTECRLQCVVDRYERLLAEKNRRLQQRDHREGDDGSIPYLSAVLRWRVD